MFGGRMRIGYCNECGEQKKLHKDYKALCQDCFNKRERDRRKELRRSPDCPFWLSKEGKRKESKRYKTAHAKEIRSRARVRAATNKKPRICIMCGGNIEGTGHYYCDACNAKRKEKKTRTRNDILLPDLKVRTCKVCGVAVGKGRYYCDGCLKRRTLEKARIAASSKKSTREHSWRKIGIVDIDTARRLWNGPKVCAICGKTSGRFAIDHDHKTGKVRGLLCSMCNTGIGQLNDDPVLLEKAIQYLQST